MKQNLQFLFAVATIVASGVVFAQATPQKAPQKPAQVAQSKGGPSAGAGQTSAPAPAAAPFGIAPVVAASLTALGALGTNDSSSPSNH